MVSEPKTLVILDTNKIRANLDWERDYSNFEPKGDFIQIIDWVEQNKLQDLVFIGLPEIVVEELVDNRCRNFDNQLEILKSCITKFEKLSCFDFSKTILPEDDFDYREFIKGKIEAYVKKKTFLLIMKLEKEAYPRTLESLMKKAVIKEKPFTDTGKGFKDALIWEIILNLKDISQYSHVFLLTENKRDFEDLEHEFPKRFSKDLSVESTTTTLIVSLENVYGLHVNYPEMLAYLKTDYFKSKLMESLVEIYDLVINNFKVTRILEISEATLKDVEEFELSGTHSEEDLSGLKRVNFLFENNNREFNAGLIIEPVSNEIVALNYEEVK